MATAYSPAQSEGRKWASSPKPKGRPNENAKNILCRNITIYGYCRHEKDGCMYNHDMTRQQNPQSQTEILKKRLNVDSPSFTPSHSDGNEFPKSASISPNAASAAPFTPKLSNSGTDTPPAGNRDHSSEWSTLGIPEFIPGHTFEQNHNLEASPSIQSSDPYNPFGGSTSFPALDGTASNSHLNPYAPESALADGAQFYQQQSAFAQPLQYHLYAPLGPQRENLPAYQRTASDFFIPENLRQELQRKADTTLQVLPNSNLPPLVEHFHSLVPLDISSQKGSASFGYPSWIYKAVSSKDGKTYALRRLEGFRLTNEKAIASGKSWKRINNGSFVTVHDLFTTRAFGDSCLVFVTDYFPLAKTLGETHLSNTIRHQMRPMTPQVSESTLWNYLVQLASALKAIHGNGLAARSIIPSKILVTNKNRLRLNTSGVLDVVQFDDPRPLAELQQEDMTQLGRLLLSLATGNPNAAASLEKSFSIIAPQYGTRLKSCILWLLGMNTSPQNHQPAPDIKVLLETLSDHVFNVLDSSLHSEDDLYCNLNRELENSRIVRVLAKLGAVNERPEYQEHGHSGAAWSETGERYYLKLFRDYVFHQVDAQGRPVVDLGHIIECLNKLDAGSEERITLTTRDDQNVFVVSYKEVRRGLESAFQELIKAGRRI